MVRFMFYKVLSGHSVENRLCGRKGELGNYNKYKPDISESRKN